MSRTIGIGISELIRQGLALALRQGLDKSQGLDPEERRKNN
jgi:hypothetical protein